MKKVCIAVIVFLLSAVQVSKADLIYQLEAFTNNGSFWQSSEIDVGFKLATSCSGVDFTFYNDSTVNSTVSRIYFDDAGLLSFKSITNFGGTKFTKDFTAANFPGGNELAVPFETDFSFSASPPPPKNGVEPGELVTISFAFSPGTVLADIFEAINNQDMRIGAHLIALPDGSSESVINVPEPGTILLFGLGGLLLKWKHKYIAANSKTSK